MGMTNDDIPKYRKKRGSNVSKSREKSKHKHEYKECLLIENNHPHRATYCTICGKIGNVYFFESEGLTVMSDKEIYSKYHNLEQFKINKLWQKYVQIEERIKP